MHADAANLYSGELLEGFNLQAPEFDRWLSTARQGFHEKAVDLLSQLLAHYIASGNLERAASIATRLLALDPLRESSHRALMELYSKQGRYAAALRQYQICVDVLARELNVEPEPGTTALYREIRALRNTPRGSVSEITRPRPETATPGEASRRAHARLRGGRSRSCPARLPALTRCPLSSNRKSWWRWPRSAAIDARRLSSVSAGISKGFPATALPRFSVSPRLMSTAPRRPSAPPSPSAHKCAGRRPCLRRRSPRASGSPQALWLPENSTKTRRRPRSRSSEKPRRIANLLQNIAPRHTILIAGRTKDLVKDLFRCSLFTEPVFADSAASDSFWQVLGETRSATRFTVLHRPDRSPFTGREAQLKDLLDCWRKAKAGEGGVVFLTGEPGIGKSRLALELQKQITPQPHSELYFQCSPFHANSVLYPFIRELERAADFYDADDAGEKLAKLAALLSTYAPAAQDIVPLFAQLLSICSEGHYPRLTLSPAQQRRKTLGALLDRVESFARRGPLLVVFEDCQWADASSLELLDLLVDRIRALPALLLITSRPGFEPAWGGLGHVRQMTLDRMTDGDARTLVQNLSSGRTPPIGVVDRIVAKTDGIPLFLEEMTEAVLESEFADGSGGEAFHGGDREFAIPATLHDLLMARLDRLGDAKATAQIAAVIGREFSDELLRAVMGPAADRLDDDLDLLGSSGLIFKQPSQSGRSFAFKHALVRDTAYQSLLKGRRQQLHGAIAGAIREAFPAVEKNHPELVARHFTDAGLIAPAVGYWLKAGMHAFSRSANREAIAHLEHGLDLVPALDAPADRRRWERQLLTVMGPAVMAVEGYAAEKSQRVFEKAHELIDEDCPVVERLRIICGLWMLRVQQGCVTTALPLAEEFMDLARQSNLGLELGNCLMGINFSSMGHFEKAHRHLLDVVESFRLDAHTPAAIFGIDELCFAQTYLARVLWSMGYPEQAAAAALMAYELAQRGASSVSVALAFVARLFLNAQNPEASDSEALIEDAMAHAVEHELPPFQNWFAFFGAAIRLRQGHAAEALPVMQATIANAESKQNWLFRPFQLGCVAEAFLQLGDADRALTAIDNAIDTGHATGEKQSEANLYRVKGEILTALARPLEAERAFQTGLAIARRQKARMEELRIALSMVGSNQAAGGADNASATLAHVYATFDEGFNLRDLRAARAVLERPRDSRTAS